MLTKQEYCITKFDMTKHYSMIDVQSFPFERNDRLLNLTVLLFISAKTRIRNSKCMKKFNSLISKEIQYDLFYYYIISNVRENTAVNYFRKINNL